MTLNGEIFGLPIPDAGPIFAAALVLHILSGLTAVIAGALAATARKQPGRHPRAGRVYLWALGGSSPPRRSWPRSVGAKTPTYSPSPLSRSASASTATAPADAPPRLATTPRHRHGRLLHRPTHRLLRRQRTLPTPVGPATPPHSTGCCPASSASRSSGLRYNASRTGQPRIPILSHVGSDHPMIAV